MLKVSYDSRLVDDISNILFYMKQIGQKVVQLNLSNVVAQETYITDLLFENPEIQHMGIGIGVSETAIEPPSKDIFERSQKFYYANLHGITLHFSPYYSPVIEFPRSLKELIIDTSPSITDGLTLGRYFNKIITKACRPSIRFINIDFIKDWEGFSLPQNITRVSFSKRRNLDPALLNILTKDGFRRVERNDIEVVYEKIIQINEEHTGLGERGD
jgi:hypothetical protein